MAAELDLNLFPFHRIQGQELPQLPGLMAVMPPKRAARGREDDYLVVYLTLAGNTRFSTSDYNHFMAQTVQRFYQTSGSLTFAIRTAAGAVNQLLINRNLHTTGKGEYMLGRLILGALRGKQFVFAQCGPTHVFHLTATETRQIHDGQIGGHGLGIAQATPLYLSQVDLNAGDLLVLCPDLPAGWDTTLLAEKNFSYETVRRKLVSTPGTDLNAVLVQALPGKGKLNILKGMRPGSEKPALAVPIAVLNTAAGPAQALPPVNQPAAEPNATGKTPPAPVRSASRVESELPANRFSRLVSSGAGATTGPVSLPEPEPAPENLQPSAAPVGQSAEQPAGQPTGKPVVQSTGVAAAPPVRPPAPVTVSPAARPVRRTGRFGAPRNPTSLPEIKRPPSRRRREIFGGLARAIQGVRAGIQRMSQGIGKFLPALVPDPNEATEVTRSSMALFAIVLPVIIVAVAATVYINYGRTAQYTQNYDMALTQAALARSQANPTDVRRAWDSTIYYLDLADKNQKTQVSSTLRQEAQTALDNLDGIIRLDFRPAIVRALSSTVQVSHMAATDTDLYLLDGAHGDVIRASMNGLSFEVDTTFKCAPGQYGTVTVGALVDLQVLPMTNTNNANVMAMDAKGNLLYCGQPDPVAAALVPPQLGWRSISAFSLSPDGKKLYVLDPTSNAVWQYSGSLGNFPDLPVMFFGNQVPQNMNSAIDLAANDSDLYMLFQDGHVTACPLTIYDVVPMRCSDPATFVDTRPERQPGPKINDAIFTQMAFASAPDPSLYMLEPLTRAVYRFSPRPDSLELRGQFRASIEQNNTLFNGPATSMTISSNRDVFISVGNQVYFAADVP